MGSEMCIRDSATAASAACTFPTCLSLNLSDSDSRLFMPARGISFSFELNTCHYQLLLISSGNPYLHHPLNVLPGRRVSFWKLHITVCFLLSVMPSLHWFLRTSRPQCTPFLAIRILELLRYDPGANPGISSPLAATAVVRYRSVVNL